MVHESGNRLESHDKESLKVQVASEEDRILRLMRVRKNEMFTAWEMAQIHSHNNPIRKGNCRRALSNLSGSDSSYRDEYGNFPVIKRVDRRRVDPETGKSTVCYQYNHDYGKKPAQYSGQLSILDQERCAV